MGIFCWFGWLFYRHLISSSFHVMGIAPDVEFLNSLRQMRKMNLRLYRNHKWFQVLQKNVNWEKSLHYNSSGQFSSVQSLSRLNDWVNFSHEVAKISEFQLQHQSFQWTPRTDLLQDGLVRSPCSPRDSQESSPTPQFKSINSSVLSFLHSPTLTSIHDHWKNQSLDQMDLCWQSNVSAF